MIPSFSRDETLRANIAETLANHEMMGAIGVKILKSPTLDDNGLTVITGYVVIQPDGETQFDYDGWGTRTTSYYSVDAFTEKGNYPCIQE